MALLLQSHPVAPGMAHRVSSREKLATPARVELQKAATREPSPALKPPLSPRASEEGRRLGFAQAAMTFIKSNHLLA